MEDLIQEGNIGLIKAIEHFDYLRFRSFTAYAKSWISQAVINSLTYLPYMVRLPSHQFVIYQRIRRFKEKFEQQNEYPPSIHDIDIGEDTELKKIILLDRLPADLKNVTCFIDNYESFEDNSSMPDEGLMEESTRIYIQGLLSFLSLREKKFLQAFYGLTGNPPETLEEIGDKYGLTRERVRQINEKSIRKLKIILGLKKKEKKENEPKGKWTYQIKKRNKISKEEGKRRIVLTEEQIEHRVNIFSQNNTNIQHYIPQKPVENEMGKGTSYYSDYLSMRELAQTQQNRRTNLNKYEHTSQPKQIQTQQSQSPNLKDSILLVLQQCKLPISLWEIVSRVNRSYLGARTERVEYLLRSMSEVECTTDGRYRLKREELRINLTPKKRKRIEKSKLHLKTTDDIISSAFYLSTPLSQLIKLRIITPKDNKHCRKKGLYTIGDVKKIIEKYNLTRSSTRFTQYTINLWFKIVDLLETKTSDNIIEKQQDVLTDLLYTNFDEIYQKYTDQILKIRQAIIYGKVIVAKPVLLLAVIDAINEGQICNNCIFMNMWLETRYTTLMYKYTNKILATDINMPFWHLKSDGFWHLHFVKLQNERKFTPSKNWLKNNVQYAYLDEDLWTLLERQEWRMKLRNFIIEHH